MVGKEGALSSRLYMSCVSRVALKSHQNNAPAFPQKETRTPQGRTRGTDKDQNLKGENVQATSFRLKKSTPKQTSLRRDRYTTRSFPKTQTDNLSETRRGGGAHGPPRSLKETLPGTATPREPKLPPSRDPPRKSKAKHFSHTNWDP